MMPVPRPTHLIIVLFCGLAACLACPAGGPSEVVLAENAVWRIRATGAPYASGGYWWGPSNVYVDFEVEKNGVPYATGRLYDSGPNDDSFKAELPYVEWVTPNAIRLYKEPRSRVPSFDIKLRNASKRRAKWIMLYGQDVFLVLDLEAGEQTAFSTLKWGSQSIDVTGEWHDGTRMHNSQVSLPERTELVDVTVSETETRIDVRRR